MSETLLLALLTYTKFLMFVVIAFFAGMMRDKLYGRPKVPLARRALAHLALFLVLICCYLFVTTFLQHA
jgi:hypothetical protein